METESNSRFGIDPLSAFRVCCRPGSCAEGTEPRKQTGEDTGEQQGGEIPPDPRGAQNKPGGKQLSQVMGDSGIGTESPDPGRPHARLQQAHHKKSQEGAGKTVEKAHEGAHQGSAKDQAHSEHKTGLPPSVEIQGQEQDNVGQTQPDPRQGNDGWDEPLRRPDA